MTASTFIFVHDQQIVLDYIASGKFHDLPDVKYCFLGMRPTDRIEHLPNVIIARNLPDNIEHYPNLVAWTGWYALVTNDLIKTDIVNLFEYDVNAVGDWVQPLERTAYFWHPYADETWWNYNGIQYELHKVVRKVLPGTLPMTSNYTLGRASLVDFVNHMVIHIFKGNFKPTAPMAGHVIERICSAYFQERVAKKGYLTHLYADSHGTQGRNAGYEYWKENLL